jgi:hypothetical protein
MPPLVLTLVRRNPISGCRRICQSTAHSIGGRRRTGSTVATGAVSKPPAMRLPYANACTTKRATRLSPVIHSVGRWCG